MLCPKCNTVNSDNEKYCKNCGFQLNASRICPQCGKVNQHNSKYCDECGATLSPVNSFKKDVISEGGGSSFFNKYKTALIAALILVLAIGAVTGIALYGGNDNGGNDEPFFPLVNGNNSQIDDNTPLNDNGSDLDDNQSEMSKNPTDDNNKSDNQAKSENKANKTNQLKSDNKAEQLKTGNKTEQVKTDNKTDVKTENKTKSVKSENKTKSVKSENKTEQVKTDNKTQTGQIIMNNKTNDSNKNQNEGSSFKIKMKDVPNLAKEVADRNYDFSSIDYKGNSYSESQCIYIFSKYVLKINSGDDSAITVKSISKAPNPNADDLSQEISKSDYISMAGRIVSFIDNNNAVPNYVGISSIGPKDLSPDKLLYLYTQIVLNYGVTGDLPESVEI